MRRNKWRSKSGMTLMGRSRGLRARKSKGGYGSRGRLSKGQAERSARSYAGELGISYSEAWKRLGFGK